MLERGTRDWNAQVALACIRYRRGDVEGMKAAFAAAGAAADKEPSVYLLWGVLLAKKDQRDEALVALGVALEKVPDHQKLKHLRHQLANKMAVDAEGLLGELWYQFFPEDLMKHLAMRGRRGGLDHLPESIRARLPQADPRAGRVRWQ